MSTLDEPGGLPEQQGRRIQILPPTTATAPPAPVAPVPAPAPASPSPAYPAPVAADATPAADAARGAEGEQQARPPQGGGKEPPQGVMEVLAMPAVVVPPPGPPQPLVAPQILPPSAPASFGGAGFSMPQPPQRTLGAPDLLKGDPKKIRTLGEMPAFWPGLADPQSGWSLVIERTKPQADMAGRKINGLLGRFAWMTDEEFQSQFGGGDYLVRVEGPGKEDPTTGQRTLRHHAEIKLSFPGAPIVSSSNGQNGQNGFFNPFPPGAPPGYGAWPHPSVETARIQQEGNLLNRLLDERQKVPGVDPFAAAALTAQTRTAELTIEAARQEAAAARQEAAELRQRIFELMQSNPQNRMLELAMSGRNNDEAIERMRRDCDDRIERMRKDCADDVKRAQDYAQTLLDREREMMRHERDALRNELRGEVARITSTYEERIRMLQQDREREIGLLREDHRRAMEAAEKDRARELAAVRDAHEREARQTKGLGELAITAKDAELTRLSSENASLKAENEALKAQVYKPFAHQLLEYNQIAEGLGYVKPEDVQQPPAVDPKESLTDRVLKAAAPAVAPLLAGLGGKYLGLPMPGMGGPPPQGPPMLMPNGAPAPRQMGPAPQPQPPPQPVPPGRRGGGQPRRPTAPPRPLYQPPAGPVSDGGPPMVYASPPEASMPASPPAPPQPASVPTNAGAELTNAVPAGEHLANSVTAQEQNTNVSPPSPTGPAQTGQPPQIPPEVLARLQAAHAAFRPHGPAPLDEDGLKPLLQQFAQEASKAYFGESEEAASFAGRFKAQLGPFVPALLGWIDATAAGHLLVLVTGGNPTVPWDLEGPRQWLAEVWAHLARG